MIISYIVYSGNSLLLFFDVPNTKKCMLHVFLNLKYPTDLARNMVAGLYSSEARATLQSHCKATLPIENLSFSRISIFSSIIAIRSGLILVCENM